MTDVCVWNLAQLATKHREIVIEAMKNADFVNARGSLDSLIKMQGGFMDRKQLDVNLLPPTEPVERSEWLEKFRLMELDIIDVTDAICRE